MASLIPEKGISQLEWRACEALRIRVSMSAMGSLMVMGGLPASLGHARDLSGQRELAEADAAQREAADECPRPAAQLTAVMRLDFEARRTTGFDDERFLGQPGPPV